MSTAAGIQNGTEELKGGTQEPALQVEFFLCNRAIQRTQEQHVVIRSSSVPFHCGQDTRPSTVCTFECRWMGEPVKITCCRCLLVAKSSSQNTVRDVSWAHIFRLAGLVPLQKKDRLALPSFCVGSLQAPRSEQRPAHQRHKIPQLAPGDHELHPATCVHKDETSEEKTTK